MGGVGGRWEKRDEKKEWGKVVTAARTEGDI
jgi:hypothetical protein